jgi:TPP-dependent pyruvate/acetoin dehydrogenase alpha subunit
MRSEPRVALTFFGDGATEEGTFHEAVNFAMVRRLPVVFVCENNLYSIASPLKARQPEGTTIWQRGNGYGMRSECLDGNDVFAVHRAAREAVEWCRTGNGPFLLELRTYRWRQHVGPNWDHDTGYRSRSEVDSWIERCPITRATRELRVEDPDIEAKADRWRAQFREEVDSAVADAKAAAFPAVEDLFEGSYESARGGRGERR